MFAPLFYFKENPGKLRLFCIEVNDARKGVFLLSSSVL